MTDHATISPRGLDPRDKLADRRLRTLARLADLEGSEPEAAARIAKIILSRLPKEPREITRARLALLNREVTAAGPIGHRPPVPAGPPAWATS